MTSGSDPAGRGTASAPARPPGRRSLRLTSLGRGIVACAVMLGAGAVVLRYVELAALAAASFTALVLAFAAVARWPRVTVELAVEPAQVRRDDSASATVTVTNHGRRRAPRFVLDVMDGPGRAMALPVRGVRGHGAREFTTHLDTTARGVVHVGPAALRRIDPFGLVARTGWVGGSAQLRVRPRPVPLEPLASPRSRDPDGPASDGSAGGVMFNALREYLPGDDLRFVHWTSSARAGQLLVREHVDPSEPTATVLLDNRRPAYPPGAAGAAAFEDAVDVVASVVQAFAGGRFPVRLVTSGGLTAHSRRRRSGAGTLLDALAEVTTDEGGGLEVLAALPRGGVGTLTLVTGGVEVGQIAAVAPVVHRFEQVVVVRVGENRYPARPGLRRLRPTPLAEAALPAEGCAGDEASVRLAGRLRVVAVAGAAELPNRWPAGGGRTMSSPGRSGAR